MKFVWYSNLKLGAKKAFDKGNGKYRKYVVNNGFIAAVGKNNRALDWMKVIKGGKLIT